MAEAYGVDVSEYQGAFDWNAAVNSGVTWAYVKALQGSRVDPQFSRNWSEMRRVGLAARGAYLFLLPGDGAAQAQALAGVVGALQPGEFLVIDYERNGSSAPLPSSQTLAAAVGYLQRQYPGHGVAVYGNQGDLSAGGAPGLGVALILAAYGANDGQEHPVSIPAGWNVKAHQYSSAGGLDRDAWLAGLDDLKAWAGGTVTYSKGDGMNVLPAGQTLSKGGRLTSPQGRYELDLQADGNLVLYDNGLAGRPAIWSSGTNNGDHLILQQDGNLVLYTVDGRPTWASGTSGTIADMLQLQDDGNLVLYKIDPAWSSNTAGK